MLGVRRHLRIYCDFEVMISVNERVIERAMKKEKNSITKALLSKDRQNVQDLKLWHQKLFVSFPSYGLQFK